MALIGTRTLAAQILLHRRNGGGDLDGWKVAGGGGFRTAYLHLATQVIYKVQGCSDPTDEYGSHYEVRHAQTLYRRSNNGILGTRVRIPKTSGFTIGDDYVVAMEYIQGRQLGWGPSTEAAEGRWELFTLCGFHDMHQGNYVVEPSGHVVPIDMGSPRKRTGEADTRLVNGIPQYDEWQAKRDALADARYRRRVRQYEKERQALRDRMAQARQERENLDYLAHA